MRNTNANECYMADLKKFDRIVYDLKPYLSSKYSLSNAKLLGPDENYIVVHTKIRLLPEVTHRHYTYTWPVLKRFFQKWKTKHTIVILGEKQLSNNLETSLGLYHNTYCDFVNACRISKNKLLDLTERELLDTPDPAVFERDLCIIRNSILTIVIGIGGPLTISIGVAPKTLIYIDQIVLDQVNPFPHIYNEANPARVIQTDLNAFMTDVQFYSQ